MFDYFKFKKNYELMYENKQLQETIESLKQTIELRKIKDSMEYENANFSIHWGGINAVSIERNMDERDIPHTIVGYMKSDGDIGEWYLYCSHETHQALVAEFSEWKNKDGS